MDWWYVYALFLKMKSININHERTRFDWAAAPPLQLISDAAALFRVPGVFLALSATFAAMQAAGCLLLGKPDVQAAEMVSSWRENEKIWCSTIL